jgi:Undecaprenyl-phosphate glucose phosphotransferase
MDEATSLLEDTEQGSQRAAEYQIGVYRLPTSDRRAAANAPAPVKTVAAHGTATADATASRWRRFAISESLLLDIVKACDLALLALTSLIAYKLRASALADVNPYRYLAGTIAGSLLWVVAFKCSKFYTFSQLRQLGGLRDMAVLWTGVIVSLVILAFLLQISNQYSRGWLMIWYLGGLISLGASHIIAAGHIAFLTQNGLWSRNVIILGAGELGNRLAEHLRANPQLGWSPAGIFDDRSTRIVADQNSKRCGSFADALRFIRQNQVDCAVIALPLVAVSRILELVSSFRETPVDVSLLADGIAFELHNPALPNLAGIPVLPIAERPIKDWNAICKSVEDVVIATTGLVLSAPLLLVIAVAIKLDSLGPVLFRQPRLGFNQRQFLVYKFRTMYSELEDIMGDRLVRRGDRRVTRVGAVLRRLSLDELPQLFNVLRGEMSIVGPRPHPLNAKAKDKLYDEIVAGYASRHRVKPGITGWAQVNGWRGETDTYEKIERRVEHDLYYVENWSVGFDLWILLLTFWRPFCDKNAY